MSQQSAFGSKTPTQPGSEASSGIGVLTLRRINRQVLHSGGFSAIGRFYIAEVLAQTDALFRRRDKAQRFWFYSRRLSDR